MPLVALFLHLGHSSALRYCLCMASPEPDIVKQLRKLAATGVQRPTAVAQKLDKLGDVCSAIGVTRWKPEEAVLIAKHLCSKVLQYIERLKQEWPAETAIEEAERDYALRALDAAFGLGEFEHYERITHRRRVFLGKEPGSPTKTLNHLRGTERKALSRLADLLVSDDSSVDSDSDLTDISEPPKLYLTEVEALTGLELLQRMQDFLNTVHADININKFAPDRDSHLLHLADFYITGLRADVEIADGFMSSLAGSVFDSPADDKNAISLLVGCRDIWLDFTMRQEKLLAAAVKSASGNAYTFLDHLESRELGLRVMNKWMNWPKCPCTAFPKEYDDRCPIIRAQRAYEFAATLCETRFPEVLEELDRALDSAHAGEPLKVTN